MRASTFIIVCHWMMMLSLVYIIVTDEVKVRISVRSKGEAVIADDIAARITDCITHELGAYDDS